MRRSLIVQCYLPSYGGFNRKRGFIIEGETSVQETTMKILIVEDEKLKRITLEDDRGDAGYQTAAFASPASALAALSQELFDVAITDLRLPEMAGLEFIACAKKLRPEMRIILITAYGTMDTATKALSIGAYDYVTKPFSTEELLPVLNRIRAEKTSESSEQDQPQAAQYGCRQIVGASKAMGDVFCRIDECLRSDRTVLLTGETGTGRDIAACVIHHNSKRSNGPFVKVSCASLSKANCSATKKAPSFPPPGRRSGASSMRIRGPSFSTKLMTPRASFR